MQGVVLVVTLFLHLTASAAAGLPRPAPYTRVLPRLPSLDFLPERARGGLLERKFASASGKLQASFTGAVQQRWLDVPLDWTSPATPSFAIRYFVDFTHFDNSSTSAPIFLSMGCEGTQSGVRCPDGDLAQRHKALCVAVEHRFYGLSLPSSENGGASTDNYKAGLSVEANLQDTRAVIDALRAETKSLGRPVVNWGGSYCGATAAWLRIKYPSHTLGAVSSSGVVNALLDFPAFDEHIAEALGAVPASAAAAAEGRRSDGATCADALASTMNAIERQFAAGRAADVKRAFSASNLDGTELGDDDFHYAIADGAAMIDQYGGKAELCAALSKLPSTASDNDRIENLVALFDAHYKPGFAAGCFYDSNCVSNSTGSVEDINSRSWRWQKCSQLGYLQRAPDGHSLRSRSLTLDALMRQCDYVFGEHQSDRLRSENAAFQAAYGGDDPSSVANASNVFFLDFSDDPWLEASVRRSRGPSFPWCLTTCDGCGHCGAGVPPSYHACFDEADKFVEGLLENFYHNK